MTTQRKTLRGIGAAVGALALAAVGVLAAGTAAYALPGPGQQGAPTAGSLIIHKYDGLEGAAGDGSVLNPAPAGDPLAGVTFTIWQLGIDDAGTCVPIDLADATAWGSVPTGSAPATLTEVQAAGFCLVDATGTASAPTDAGGLTSFAGLDLGLYYLQETGAPANVVSRTAPFYVTVPLPNDAATGGWLYDVNVYPKNQTVDAPVKTINVDAAQPANGLTVGDVVQWTITETVPPLDAGQSYTSASIWDVLPASLSYTAGINTQSVTLTRAGVPATWVDGTEYTFDPDGLTWTLNTNGGVPDIIDTIQAGDIITITFTTTVESVTTTGAIANPGGTGVGPGYGSGFNGGTTTGATTPQTYWGQLTVNKEDDLGNPLSGATFQVFDNYDAGTSSCPSALPTSGAVATGTSDSTGVVQWDNTDPASEPLGLWIANSANGPIDPAPTKSYCLYETVVPVGHTAVQTGQAVSIAAGTANALVQDVVNTRRTTPNLPLTGGQGTVVLSIAGLAIAATGVGTIILKRRRRSDSGA
ncbi:SpaH/EbpB family LPXTG-anchored major pilin [Microbacterium sp.]|uniref:SpaH/EbpB family LPXTG-anchored major pilin n=1 Tax=Microbacterium sp. TaxID=51671 RepID=UPI003A8643C6